MGKKLDLTPEQRKERSERAKKLVAEGKIGGPRPGSGRPKKKRASEYVAEAARAHAKDIAEAFVDSIAPTAPPAIRLQAAKDWLLIEQKEAEIQIKEERTFDDMTETELRDLVMQRLEKIYAGEAVGEEEDVIDVEGVEVFEAEPEPDFAIEEEEGELGEYEIEPVKAPPSPWGRGR